MNPLSLVKPIQFGARANQAPNSELVSVYKRFSHSVEQGKPLTRAVVLHVRDDHGGPRNDVVVFVDLVEGSCGLVDARELGVRVDEAREDEGVGGERLDEVAVGDCEGLEVARLGAGLENDGEEDVVVRGGVEGEAHEAVERNDAGGGVV